MKRIFKDRYSILAISFILIGVVIISQLVNLQVIHGKELDEKSQTRLLNVRKIVAPRGNIYDRYGVPIAVNRQGFTVQIVKTNIKLDELNEVALKLVNIFEKNNDTYNKTLSKYLTINPIDFGSAVKQAENKIEKIKKDIDIKSKDFDSLQTPEEVFRYFRNTLFKIDPKYTDEEAYKIMTIRFEILIRGYSVVNPVVLAKDVSMETVAEVEERHDELPGVTTDVEPMRKYIDGTIIAHVLGYVRNISEKEYEKLKDQGYSRTDIIGKEGIEAAAEPFLKGKDGLKRVEVDTEGRLTEELDSNPAIPGKDVVLTIDMRLQKVAMESLQKNIENIRHIEGRKNFGDANAGAVVAMDVNTGEVLAMASYPSYDPSIWLAGPDNKDAQKAISDLFDEKNVGRPAFNRAIQGIYAPGSTYKPIVGIAGLEEGIIGPNDTIYDEGVIYIDGQKFTSLEYREGAPPQGNLTLERALATSNNIFFHKLGMMTTIDKIDKWAKYFGLGEKTGIEIPGEAKGIRANREYKKTVIKDDWRRADTAQAAIGQLYNAFTPLQLANYVSALANGGKRYKPYLIKRVVNYDGSVERETKPEFEQIPIKQETIDAIQAGMRAVTGAEDGTAAYVFRDFPFKVAGKTGTAETGRENIESSNALFVAYAPAEAPKIAVAVVVEHGVFGAYTAPIARDILAEYFGLNNKSNYDDKIKVDEVELSR